MTVCVRPHVRPRAARVAWRAAGSAGPGCRRRGPASAVVQQASLLLEQPAIRLTKGSYFHGPTPFSPD